MAEKKYKAILIFGPPGAGKGTQAKLISEKNSEKYLHFSTGEMFRNMKNDEKMRDSEVGKKIMQIMEAGNLVSDDLTVELFFRTLEEYTENKKFNPKKQILILDGLPRNVNQTDLIQSRVDVKKIIYLCSSDDDVLAERLVKRAALEGRTDDKKPDIIKKRLEIYKRDTEAVLHKYSQGIVLKVDALLSIEETSKILAEKLKL